MVMFRWCRVRYSSWKSDDEMLGAEKEITYECWLSTRFISSLVYIAYACTDISTKTDSGALASLHLCTLEDDVIL